MVTTALCISLGAVALAQVLAATLLVSRDPNLHASTVGKRTWIEAGRRRDRTRNWTQDRRCSGRPAVIATEGVTRALIGHLCDRKGNLTSFARARRIAGHSQIGDGFANLKLSPTGDATGRRRTDDECSLIFAAIRPSGCVDRLPLFDLQRRSTRSLPNGPL